MTIITFQAMSKRIAIGTLLTLFLLGGATLRAQQDDNQEKIKALKVAFFTEQLSLTSKEATVFWPLYNAYEAEKEAIMGQKRREVFDKIGGSQPYSEAEAREILNRYQELEEREDALDRKFQTELAATFSATRTLKLFRAEHEFRKRLLREYRKRNGNRP
jgi:hypothetical protein